MAAVKVRELRSVLERFADALETNKADRASVRNLRGLCAILPSRGDGTVTDFLSALKRARPPKGDASGPLVGSLLPVIASLRAFVSEIAKKDLSRSLDSLLDMLRTRLDTPIASLAAAVKEDVASASEPRRKRDAEPMDRHLVDDYVKRLEAALGDDWRFKPLFEELLSDERITQSEAVAIASYFYGQTSKGTSRAKALQRVRERQEKLMEFKKRPSTAGRSAA